MAAAGVMVLILMALTISSGSREMTTVPLLFTELDGAKQLGLGWIVLALGVTFLSIKITKAA